jgi:uncharacterized protein GlcG (DUF336 family)
MFGCGLCRALGQAKDLTGLRPGFFARNIETVVIRGRDRRLDRLLETRPPTHAIVPRRNMRAMHFLDRGRAFTTPLLQPTRQLSIMIDILRARQSLTALSKPVMIENRISKVTRMLSQPSRLGLKDARRIIGRAVDKSESLGVRGAFVVADDGGILLSASRMDGSGSIGIPISRAKTYEAAANREASQQFARRVSSMFVGIYMGYERILRDKVFPGPGAILIQRDNAIVGAISTAGSIGPFCKYPGLDPRKLILHGKPTNAEDLIISYAAETAYVSQHGDDLKRWIDAYGEAASPSEDGFAHEAAPAASKQPILKSAVALADAALAIASDMKVAACVAIADRHGDLVQQDRMDHAPPMAPDLAGALAHTAINFQRPTGEIEALLERYPRLATIGEVAPFPVMPIPGGVPVFENSQVAGAIGVGCTDPDMADKIARLAVEAWRDGGHSR